MQDSLSYYNNNTEEYLNSNVYKLQIAIAHVGTIDAVRRVLDDDIKGDCYKVFFHAGNPAGNSFLLSAIARELDPKIVELLIDDAKIKLTSQEYDEFLNYQYRDPEYPQNGQRERNYLKNTALTLSAKYAQYDLVEKLLNAGADPNGEDQFGITALSILCTHLGLVAEEKNLKILDVIKLLRQKGADATHIDLAGLQPLDYLTKDLDGKQIAVYILFPDIQNSLTEFGYPLYGAVEQLEREISTALVDHIRKAKNNSSFARPSNKTEEEWIKECTANVIKAYYAYASGSTSTTDAKIYESLRSGDKIVGEQMGKYAMNRDNSFTPKRDFFVKNAEGKLLKKDIENLFVSQLKSPSAVEKLEQQRAREREKKSRAFY